MNITIDIGDYTERQFIDHIVGVVVSQFHDKITSQIQTRISEVMEERFGELTMESARKLLDTIMTDGFQRTDEWGGPKGPPLKAKEWFMSILQARRYGNSPTNLDDLVKEQINEAIKKELKVELEEIRKRFRDEVDAVLQVKLKESLRASLGLNP